MPFFVGCLALLTPRFAIVLVVIFSDYIGRAYQTTLWPFVGFLFLPLTTLAYALASIATDRWRGSIWSWWWLRCWSIPGSLAAPQEGAASANGNSRRRTLADPRSSLFRQKTGCSSRSWTAGTSDEVAGEVRQSLVSPERPWD
jgi:hypothetical protein